jgi:hypothetical protein
MNFGLVIPQIFYDLIARIVPGMTILTTSYFVYRGSDITTEDIRLALNWFTSNDTHIIFVFLSFILVSYILALIIEGLGMFLELRFKIFSRKYSAGEYNDIIGNVSDDFKTSNILQLPNFSFASIPIMLDFIRMKEPGVGSRLVKLRAESNMCRILILGWSVLLFCNIFNFQKSSYLTIFIEILLIVAIGTSFHLYKHLRERYLWGLCNHWVLINNCGINSTFVSPRDKPERTRLAAPDVQCSP